MTSWNFADVFEAVAARVPDRAAFRQDDRIVTWAEFDARANALAADLLAAGLDHQSRVAIYTTNRPEYLEAQTAAMKAAMVPCNVNFRYGAEEVAYLLADAEAGAVVVAERFLPVLAKARSRVPSLRKVYVLADGSGEGRPDWAEAYEDVVGPGAGPVTPPGGRSGDDIVQLYTGGTTGLPKGVLWRQDDLFVVAGCVGQPMVGIGVIETVADAGDRAAEADVPYTLISASPLMHGTGQFCSMLALSAGGTVVTLSGASFDPAELWAAAERTRAAVVVIAGQAFAVPMLAELDAHPGQWDLSSLRVFISSGVMWSQSNKEGLLRHLPHVALFDSLGSSEAIGLGGSLSTADAAAGTADFMLGENVAVFSPDGRRIEPGSGEAGLLATSGNIPLGYHNDPVKTAATFPTMEGKRWSMPGDWAEVRADGSLHLLGRGSVCINTGGEKVYPEEVEEVLKTHAAVADAVVLGLPDDRLGQRVVAVVEPGGAGGAGELPIDELGRLVRERLAPFKIPRQWVMVGSINRAPNGKVDYKRLTEIAAAASPLPG